MLKYGQPSGQVVFLTLNSLYILKVKPTPKQAIENQNKITALERSVINYWRLKSILPHPQFLIRLKTFSWLFGSPDNLLSRQ